MLRKMVTDHIWSRLAPILKSLKIHFSFKMKDFMEAVLWKLRTGAPWRDLPTEFGPHSTVFNKFNRWSHKDYWFYIFTKIRGELDDEWNFIDSTIIRAHQHATGYFHKNQDIGKSVGGNSTKIHMLSDSYGNPVDFIITPGQTHDSQAAEELIDMSNGENIIADRAYSDQNIRHKIQNKNSQPIIPKKSNAIDKSNPGFDSYLYKTRHLAENLFARLKHFRSIATRYDKMTNNFSSMLYLACSFIWSKI